MKGLGNQIGYLIFFCYLFSCTSIKATKNVTYAPSSAPNDSITHLLDIYAPKKTEKSPVLVFIHGGSWDEGDKKSYRFFGNRLARKGIVAVIINYRLSPQVEYVGMANDAAHAVKWVKEHIEDFGGDREKIFVSGHSAGGHIAALISIRREYFQVIEIESPIKGVVLIDAAGLDMYSYLKEEGETGGKRYLKTFSTDPDEWREASPLYHLNSQSPPFLIYRGGKTYPSIIKSNDAFAAELAKYVSTPNYKVQKNKGHINMIVQFFFSPNPRYKEIERFMDDPAERVFR